MKAQTTKGNTSKPTALSRTKPDMLYDAGADFAETDSLRDMLAARKFDVSQKPPAMREVYSLAGTLVCTPGNLTALTAQAKAGKSAVIGAMLATTLPHKQGVDLLGFESDGNPFGKAVIHLDTEQSRYDAYYLLARALKRAGVKACPPWLMSYALADTSWNQARLFLTEAVAVAKEQFGGIHSIFIDGGADMIADVNNPEESNAFVAELHALAICEDCPIINVLHLNPGSDAKSRGHFGSQLERKAETNLRVERVGDIAVIFSDKQRRKNIPKECGPRFRWCDKAMMHISTDLPLPALVKGKQAKSA